MRPGSRSWWKPIALAAGCIAAACANPAAANGDHKAMSDPKPAFAQALKTSPEALSAFIAVPIGAAGQADALWLGSHRVGGEPQTWAIAACGARPCPGAKPLSLPTASELAIAALIDLQGAPFKLDLRQLPARTQPLQKPKSPALLVRARHKLDSGELRDTLVLLSTAKSPKILWQETANSTLPDGSGFQSLELSFKKPARGSMLDLGLLQHALAAKGQPPGPPLVLEFVLRQGAYQRAR
jgi:hypothetical protein